jgi:hypothetical protein
MSESYSAAARGVPAAQLPAFELAEPAATRLRGYLPQMASWNWQPAPPGNRGHNLPLTTRTMELRVVDAN